MSTVLSFQKNLRGEEKEINNLIRHVILSSILACKRKYSKEYGDIVIACDGRNYWRKEIFEHYKSGRKKYRDSLHLNWDSIFESINQMREDLKSIFPYRVIYNDRAEADDIIAILCKWAQDHDLVEIGLFDEPQNILIYSSDKDFKQLHLYENVKQYSPIQKKYVTTTRQEIIDYKIEHIVRGDSGDGIMNILSPSDVFVSGGRQKPLKAERLADFLLNGKAACQNDEERKNWDRNENLVSFEKIPEDITNTIIEQYINYVPKRKPSAIMDYLIENRCKLLLEHVQDF